jgi:hypothetical protein
MSRLFKAQLGSCNRKLLAVRLADFADDDGRGIWPTVARLAAETELSERTVQRILREFEDEGLLVVVAEGGRKPGQATRYDFSMAALERIFERKPEANGCQADTGDTVSPVSPATDMGDTGDGYGCHGDTQTIKEPLDKPSTGGARENAFPEGEENASAEPVASKAAIERAFLKWHPTWPKYPNGSEDAARRAWFALSPAERAECIERTPDFIEQAKAAGAGFTYSSVYLSEKAWKRLPPKSAGLMPPEVAAPFGKAGMAYRLWIMNQAERAHPLAPPMVQRMIDEGGPRAEDEIISRRGAYSWPRLVELNRRIEEREPIRVLAGIAGLGADFVSTDLTGPAGMAWKRFFRKCRLPWLPFEPKAQDGGSYAYLPAIEPDGDSDGDLDRAVAAAWWRFAERCKGHADAA